MMASKTAAAAAAAWLRRRAGGAALGPREDAAASFIGLLSGRQPRLHFSAAAAASDAADSESVPASSSPAQGVSSEVQKAHGELMETMRKRCIPSSASVASLFSQCSSPSDIKAALEVVARLRTTRAVQRKQHANFSQNLSQIVLNACLRVNDHENALKTLWTHSIYGFTPSLEAAHQILVYAKQHHDLSLMQKTLKTMALNSLSPTRSTADIVLRICKDQGNEGLLFTLAKDFHEKGLELRPALYDVCVASAANAGDAGHVLEIQRWRDKLNLPATTASTFALSKVHLMKGRPKDAAELISTQVKESEERDMYLRVLIQAWPAEILSRRKRSVNEADLKTAIEAMLRELRDLGCQVEKDAAQQFAKGKETVRKVVYG